MSGDKLYARAESALNGTGAVKKFLNFMGVSAPPKEEAMELFVEAGSEYASQGDYFKAGMSYLRAGDLAAELKQFPKIHYMEAQTQFNNGNHQLQALYARIKQISPEIPRNEKGRISDQIAKGCAEFPTYQALACHYFFQAADAYQQESPAQSKAAMVQAIDLAILLSEPVSQTFSVKDEAERALRDCTLIAVSNLRKLVGVEQPPKAPMNPTEVPYIPEGLAIAKKMVDIAFSSPGNKRAKLNVNDYVQRLLLLHIVQGGSLAEFEKLYNDLKGYFQYARSQSWFDSLLATWTSQEYDAIPVIGQKAVPVGFTQAEMFLVHRAVEIIQNRIRQGFDTDTEHMAQNAPQGPAMAADDEWND